jgi:hypothetical protein
LAVAGVIRLDWDDLDWQDIATINDLYKEQ